MELQTERALASIEGLAAKSAYMADLDGGGSRRGPRPGYPMGTWRGKLTSRLNARKGLAAQAF